MSPADDPAPRRTARLPTALGEVAEVARAPALGLLLAGSTMGFVRLVGADPGALTWGVSLPLLGLARRGGGHAGPRPAPLPQPRTVPAPGALGLRVHGRASPLRQANAAGPRAAAGRRGDRPARALAASVAEPGGGGARGGRSRVEPGAPLPCPARAQQRVGLGRDLPARSLERRLRVEWAAGLAGPHADRVVAHPLRCHLQLRAGLVAGLPSPSAPGPRAPRRGHGPAGRRGGAALARPPLGPRAPRAAHRLIPPAPSPGAVGYHPRGPGSAVRPGHPSQGRCRRRALAAGQLRRGWPGARGSGRPARDPAAAPRWRLWRSAGAADRQSAHPPPGGAGGRAAAGARLVAAAPCAADPADHGLSRSPR